MATKHVLCRYYLHGACRNGADCPFSHSLQDSESQVCRYYLKGECAYGERCRYLHAKPDWAAARRGGADSSHAAAPTVRRPAVDDLAEQLPISQLRLGGAAAAAAGGQGGGAGSPAGGTAGATGSSRPGGFGSGSSLGRPATAQTADGLPLPLPLPADPFGAAQGGDGDVAAGDDSEWQEGGEAQWGEEEEEYWEHGGDEGEGEWGEYYDEDGGEEGHWGEAEGGGDEWQEGEAHSGWQQGQQEQHAALQPPAPGAGSGQQQRQQAWATPAELTEQQQWAATAPPSLRSLCQQFFRSGSCQQGASCKLVHGELCPHCHKYALHPADSAAREQHLAECRLRHERLAARARSAGVECGICLEPVLSKATPGDRRFGLLTGCDHPFCLRCIRSWRQKTDAGADIDTALRTCPVCRTTSHYIVPSMVWPADHEEKERILAGKQAPPNPRMKIWHSLGQESPLAAYQGGRASSPYLPWPAALYERGWLPGYQRLLSNSCMPFSALPAAGYKAKLGSIDCMHFNYGEGQCPFGTSCFYRHAYPDGRLEEPSLRRIVDEEGVRVVQPVRLSDFIAISAAGARLTGGRRR